MQIYKKYVKFLSFCNILHNYCMKNLNYKIKVKELYFANYVEFIKHNFNFLFNIIFNLAHIEEHFAVTLQNYAMRYI